MWISILLKIIVSFIIILLGHRIWIYLKDTYSVKKTKDLVGSQIQKYKMILNDIQEAEKIKEKEKEKIKEKEKLRENQITEQSSQLVTYNSEYIDLKKDLEQFLQEIQ
jgi:hypothetical protein